jgi:hypothetical protein
VFGIEGPSAGQTTAEVAINNAQEERAMWLDSQIKSAQMSRSFTLLTPRDYSRYGELRIT